MKTTYLSLVVLVWFVMPFPSLADQPDRPREDPAVLAKIKALQDRNNSERKHIVRELGELGPHAKAAIPALMDVVKDEPDLRQAAAAALGKIGAAAVPLLIETLNDPDKSVRLATIFGLQWARADAKPAIPILVKLLKAGDAEVRIEIIGALSWIPCPESVQVLADELVSEQDYGVRWLVADSLSELGPEAKAAAPAMAKVLRELTTLQKLDPLPPVVNSGPPGWRHPIPDLDFRIGRAFKRIGEGAVPTLTDLLKARDKDLRCRVLVILMDMGNEAKSSIPAVMKCLEDSDPEVRLRAAGTLSHLGRDALRSLPALLQLLQDPSTEVRLEAAHTILYLNSPSDKALAVLLEGMRDRKRDVRLRAIAAFQGLGLAEKRVVLAVLAAAKDDENELVRKRALGCLADLDPPPAVVVPVLNTWLTDASEEVRAMAAEQLGEVKDSNLAVPLLLRALQDASAQVRIPAAKALGKHGKGAVSAVPVLTKMSEDDTDINIRYAATCALEGIRKAQEKE